MIDIEISPGDRYQWLAHPNQPALKVEGIDGLGALAAVKATNESTGVLTSFGISEFRTGIANGKFSKLPQDCEKHAPETQEGMIPGLNGNLLIPQTDGALLGSVEGAGESLLPPIGSRVRLLRGVSFYLAGTELEVIEHVPDTGDGKGPAFVLDRTNRGAPVAAWLSEFQDGGFEVIGTDRDDLYDVTAHCPVCQPYTFRVRYAGDGLIQPCPACGLLPDEERPTLAEQILGPEICATDRDFERATAIPAIENFPETAALAGRDPVTDATIEEIRAVVETPKRPTDIHANTTNEWYTPARYVEAAREVMGAIDLDPASNKMANETVKADAFYTAEEDGSKLEWYGRVWLNPPYNDGGSAKWSARLIDLYKRGFVEEAILLVNASTEAGWFKALWVYPICFTDHRIAFYGPGEKKAQPRYGNAFVYLGQHPDRFRQVFEQFGAVTMPSKPTEPSPLPQGLDALRAEEAAIVEQIKGLNARLEEVYRRISDEEQRSEKRQELEALKVRMAELNRDLGITA